MEKKGEGCRRKERREKGRGCVWQRPRAAVVGQGGGGGHLSARGWWEAGGGQASGITCTILTSINTDHESVS